MGTDLTTLTPKEHRRLRDASDVMAQTLEAMYAQGVPIDSCILAAEISREAGRALGYRARMFPVRVKVLHEDGREGRSLGYEFREEAMAEDRYNGHVICLWDDRVALDPTAPQMDPEIIGEGEEDGIVRPVRAEAIPSLAFPVTREFVKREAPLTIGPFESGWALTYEGFDDHGDWAKPTKEMDSRTRMDLQKIGAFMARKVRGR